MEREIHRMEQRILALTAKLSTAKVPEIPFELLLDKVLAMLLAAEGEEKSNRSLNSNQALFTCDGLKKDNC